MLNNEVIVIRFIPPFLKGARGILSSQSLLKGTLRFKCIAQSPLRETLRRQNVQQAMGTSGCLRQIGVITRKAQNQEKWQYPLEAIREIVTNMIVHRDYRAAADSIVKIYDHKIEFFNPGRLTDTITIEDLLVNRYKSSPRNKLIADVCKNLGIVEKYGSGIKRILQYFSQAGLTVPQFQNISDGFMVTVFDGSTVEKTVEKTDELIIALIRANARITIAAIQKHLNLSRREVEWQLNQLKEKGLLKRIGPDKGGRWEIIQIGKEK